MASQQSGACARANINGSACRTRHSASTNPWTIRVLAMAGRILVVPCGAGILTSIASIKRQVASLQPALAFWPTDHMFLLRPPALADAAVVELEHSSHAATSVIDEATGIPPERAGSEEPLADSNTLSDCGIGDGDLLHLLVRPIEWSESELAIQHRVQGCGATLDVPESGLGQRAIAAIVWAMSNEVNHFA